MPPPDAATHGHDDDDASRNRKRAKTIVEGVLRSQTLVQSILSRAVYRWTNTLLHTCASRGATDAFFDRNGVNRG